jgi:exodeoxyribonuclease VII large subunit
MKNINNYISVTILNNYIHNSLASEDMLRGVTVFGEISAYKISGPHAYFILKDTEAQINCNCFNYVKCYQPKDGESVLITGNVDYYAKNGKLSFNVIKMEPVGLGLLAIKLEQLKQKLKEEGLFDGTHKVPIPAYPLNVCVLTSKTGAVIRDIITTVRKVNKEINISLFDVKVQGIGAENTIINALKIADKMKFDVIIIARLIES